MTAPGLPSDGAADREKRAAARSSVIAAVFLTILKFIVGLVTGSLGILAEAAHSLLDLVAAVITYLAVRFSAKPADRDHPYGHGKIENFSALIETGLLFATCAWIVYESVRRIFFASVEVNPSIWAFLVMGISIGVDVSRSRMLYRVARKHHSLALEADAIHFSTDIWSSSVVIVGLVLVWLGRNVFPRAAHLLHRADAVAALGVAVIVFFVTFRLGRRTMDVLLDRAPDGIPQRLGEAAAEVEGVLGVGQVRVRRSGPRLFVDMTVDVDRNLSFERTHAIAEDVEARIQSIAPGADVVVHTDPREMEREALTQRIRAVAYRNQMAVHNIALHDDKGHIFVDLHLEVDDQLSLEQAHEMASDIEKDLRADMREIDQVYVHLESRGSGVVGGRDVTHGEGELVEKVKRLTDEIAGPERCHDVLVRRQGDRLLISLHCHLDPQLSIVEIHNITTRIEMKLKERIPGVDRCVVHAEPFKISDQ